jgi:ribosome-interacting GTPase 1
MQEVNHYKGANIQLLNMPGKIEGSAVFYPPDRWFDHIF